MTAPQRTDLHRHERWTTAPAGARRAAFDRFNSPRRWPWWMLDTVRSRERAAHPEHLDALAEITLPDHDGRDVRLRELWRDGPAVIVWLRQFGCPFCRSYAVRLNRASRAFAAAGARIVLIGQGTPLDAARFRRQMGIGLQVLADADRVTYLWAGTKLATLDELIGPIVLVRGLLAMAQERVLLGHNTADEAQLGGSIVVTPAGAIAFAHISEDASDMAPVRQLVDAARRATSEVAPAHQPGTASRPSVAAQSPRRRVKVGAIAILAMLGSLLVHAPTTRAAPGAIPVRDPGVPTYDSASGVSPLQTDHSVPSWSASFVDPLDGRAYKYTMVGRAPGLAIDTTVAVDIVPIDLTFRGSGNFALRGSDVAANVLASPIFQPSDFTGTTQVSGAPEPDGHVSLYSGGELSNGNSGVQYLDAVMRSEFNRTGSGYHLRLAAGLLPPLVLTVPSNLGAVFLSGRGVPYGLVSYSWLAGQLTAALSSPGPDPAHLVVFLTNNVLAGGVIAFHGASRLAGTRGQIPPPGSQPVWTFVYNAYVTPGTFNPYFVPMLKDVYTLSHELAEWANDPFVSNAVIPWIAPGTTCYPLLETGDPVYTTGFVEPGDSFDTGTFADGSWHLEDEAFLPWFSHEAPNVTSQPTQLPSPNGGRYTFLGDLNRTSSFHVPAATC